MAKLSEARCQTLDLRLMPERLEDREADSEGVILSVEETRDMVELVALSPAKLALAERCRFKLNTGTA